MLSKTLDLHEGVLDELPLGVIVLAEDTRVILYNRAEQALSRRQRDDVVGKPFFDAVAPCMNTPEMRARFDAARPPECRSGTTEFAFPFPHRPRPTQVRLHFRPLQFDGRCLVGLFVEDITAHALVVQERDRLLSAMFHDLRSPLSAMSMFAEVAAESLEHLTPGELSEELKRIAETCAELAGIVDVTTHRLAGGGDEERQQLDLTFLVHGLAIESRRAFEEAGMTLTVNGVPLGDRCDEHLVTVRIVASRIDTGRALRNLLENAKKYGRARVDVEVREHEDGVWLAVHDDGPGIPAGWETRVFEERVQAPGALRGTGLGLASVRKWVEAVGGTAAATRSPLGGACIAMRLPLAGMLR